MNINCKPNQEINAVTATCTTCDPCATVTT